MAVYVDPLFLCIRNLNWRYDTSCHLFGDSEAEVLGFGRKIGLKESWFQKKLGRLDHFDLNESKRAKAIEAGAIPVSMEFVAERIKEARNAIRDTIQ